jgi:hypothetical protein
MTAPETAYAGIETLVKRFKALSSANRKSLNENATDARIDWLVYALYGLMEAGIKIVEAG